MMIADRQIPIKPKNVKSAAHVPLMCVPTTYNAALTMPMSTPINLLIVFFMFVVILKNKPPHLIEAAVNYEKIFTIA